MDPQDSFSKSWRSPGSYQAPDRGHGWCLDTLWASQSSHPSSSPSRHYPSQLWRVQPLRHPLGEQRLSKYNRYKPNSWIWNINNDKPLDPHFPDHSEPGGRPELELEWRPEKKLGQTPDVMIRTLQSLFLYVYIWLWLVSYSPFVPFSLYCL